MSAKTLNSLEIDPAVHLNIMAELTGIYFNHIGGCEPVYKEAERLYFEALDDFADAVPTTAEGAIAKLQDVLHGLEFKYEHDAELEDPSKVCETIRHLNGVIKYLQKSSVNA